MLLPEVDEFDFDWMRRIQNKYVHPPKLEADCAMDKRLMAARSAVEIMDYKGALEILNGIVDSAAELTALLPQALARRAGVHIEMRNHGLAREDARRAVVLKPTCIEGYLRLSSAETELRQFGRADVALALGLKMHPSEKRLRSKLNAIRRQESHVGPSVRKRNFSDRPVREKQRAAIFDIPMGNFLSLPFPFCYVISGDLMNLKKAWNLSFAGLKHGRINIPLIHFPILGIQRLHLFNLTLAKSKVEDFKRIIDFLFDQGERLDARDDFGYTAVMHAAGWHPQPELLEHLLKRGADPNIHSVYGTVALHDAVSKQNVTEVDLLLSYDADPDAKDNDLCCVRDFAANFNVVAAVFDKHLRGIKPRYACGACGACGGDKKTTCQKEDWPNHKKKCQIFRRRHKRVAIAADRAGFLQPDAAQKLWSNIMNPNIPADEPKKTETLFDVFNIERQKKGNLVLKVQAAKRSVGGAIPSIDKSGSLFIPDKELDRDSPLLVHNETRSFQCYVDPGALDVEDVRKVLEAEGVGGCKAYFWAFMEKGKKEIVLITDPVLSALPW